MAPKSVAVIGGGIAGVTCAKQLLSAGLDVVVFEKARGVGGRMSTRRTDWAQYDHGTQYFTVRDPGFRRLIEGMLSNGTVAIWQPTMDKPDPEPWYVATPGMTAIARFLSKGLDVRTSKRVVALTPEGAQWRLTFEDEGPSECFDAVVVAVPNEQAVTLLEPVQPTWAGWLRAVPTLPCWTLMVSTSVLDVRVQAGSGDPGPIGWFAQNDSKPGRTALAGQQDWVVQATSEWTIEHLESDKAEVTQRLMDAFKAVLGVAEMPILHTPMVHRWLYSRRTPGIAPVAPSLWSASAGLGVCGDGLTHSRVEQAYLSGQHLANAMLAGA
jgi:renalase